MPKRKGGADFKVGDGGGCGVIIPPPPPPLRLNEVVVLKPPKKNKMVMRVVSIQTNPPQNAFTCQAFYGILPAVVGFSG